MIVFIKFSFGDIPAGEYKHCSYKCVTSETIKSFVSRTNGSSIWNGALISIGGLSESIVIAAI